MMHQRNSAPARTAIFVDGENISADHADAIGSASGAQVQTAIRRVYGDVARIGRWTGTPGFRPVHTGTGKNAADMALDIDAVDLAAVGAYETAVIATSDGDFTHLATWLRERGVTVIGCGEAKAPSAFRAACHAFVEVGASSVRPNPRPRCAESAPVPIVATLRDDIMRLVAGAGADGMPLAKLNPALRSARPGFRIADHPRKTWRANLEASPELFKLDPKGPEARIRLLPNAKRPTDPPAGRPVSPAMVQLGMSPEIPST